jgi:hypothetical protein
MYSASYVVSQPCSRAIFQACGTPRHPVAEQPHLQLRQAIVVLERLGLGQVAAPDRLEQ